MKKRICVVGGGISGLTAAFLLASRGFDVTLYEAASSVGGNIRTETKDGFLLEHGPNSLLRSPRLVQLIDDLELRNEVLPASPSAKKRFVLQGGMLKPLPTGLGSFVFGNYFSMRGKLRLMKEPFVSSRSEPGESVASFFERRLGEEIVEKAVDPFISGIFAGDPTMLSVREAFPKLFDMERGHGSLLRGALKGKREPVDRNFPRSFTFKNGLSTLTGQLQRQIGDGVRLATPAAGVERDGEGYRVELGDGSGETFDAVIVSTKADAAAELIGCLDRGTADRLRKIYYPPITVVRSGYRSAAVKASTEGFGFLVPKREKRGILGSLWTSSVFPGRAPEGRSLFTTFIGGARSPELFELWDEETTALVHRELGEILEIGEGPVFTSVTRWKKAIPQYNIGYSETVEAIENFTGTHAGLFICSNFYRGISVGDCVKNAYQTAEDAAAFLDRR